MCPSPLIRLDPSPAPCAILGVQPQTGGWTRERKEMTILLYAALSIVAVNIFAAVVYSRLHQRRRPRHIPRRDHPRVHRPHLRHTQRCPRIQACARRHNRYHVARSDVYDHADTETHHHPSLDPSSISRETPTPSTTPSKRPVYTDSTPRAHRSEKKTAPVRRHHFDDREKELQTEQRGTEPGAGGCDDIAAGGCK